MSLSLGDWGPGRPPPWGCSQTCNLIPTDFLSLRIPQDGHQRAQWPGLAALSMHGGLDGQWWGVLCRQVASGLHHVSQMASADPEAPSWPQVEPPLVLTPSQGPMG